MQRISSPATWTLLVASVSGAQAALRIRAWRALKAAGAVLLRDGVYVMPASAPLVGVLEEQRAEIAAAGGSAFVLPLGRLDEGDEAAFVALFDRHDDYAALRTAIDAFVAGLPGRIEGDARRALRQLKRDFAAIEAIDFFPAAVRTDVANELRHAESAVTRAFSPEEPAAVDVPIAPRERAGVRGSVWATRERLWVDRVASAWLIRRFIDPDARFVWLRRVADRPPDALGFDFDGAAFTHVGERVTFEVLVASFELEGDAALERLGLLVRALDTGSVRVAEAAGFETMLAGARERTADDDALLAHVGAVLDDLYTAFSQPRRATGAS